MITLTDLALFLNFQRVYMCYVSLLLYNLEINQFSFLCFVCTLNVAWTDRGNAHMSMVLCQSPNNNFLISLLQESVSCFLPFFYTLRRDPAIFRIHPSKLSCEGLRPRSKQNNKQKYFL